ncbi:MAG TPA: TraR/DksA C4-type zinc finger protein [Thermomicrobiales bacterium]|jgi:RNA polymerase-binding transcription factor DksA|nr:TraR/DksA C4-type zinc finger protein [Thermomicrobiales bacterium]
MTIDDATMTRLRGILEERKADLTGQIEGLAGDVQALGVDDGEEGGGLSNHPGDSGTDVEESERLSTIGIDLQENLNQVNDALARMDDGTYGTCRRCGKPINPERLEAFPWVQYDIECQALIEQGLAPADNA